MTAAHNGRVRREGSCGISLQVSSLASLGCMNCPGTTWRLEDRAHVEKVTVAKGVRERHSTEGRLEGNMKKTQPKHPTCTRESRPMARSLAWQRASESQRHYRLRWPSKGPLSPSPLTLPSALSGLQKVQKWPSELGGGGAGAGNSTRAALPMPITVLWNHCSGCSWERGDNGCFDLYQAGVLHIQK